MCVWGGGGGGGGGGGVLLFKDYFTSKNESNNEDVTIKLFIIYVESPYNFHTAESVVLHKTDGTND